MLTVVSILFLVVLLLVCAFFAGVETALFSLPLTKVKSFRHNGDLKKQTVAELLAQPGDLLITLIVVNILCSVLTQNTVASLVHSSKWIFNIGVPLVLVLVLGEVLPKSLCLTRNTALSLFMAPIVMKLHKALFPFRKVLMYIVHGIARAVSFFFKKEKEISSEELKHALTTSKQTGIVQEEEADLVSGYLQLQELQIKDLQRPREDILYFDVEDSLDKLEYLFVDQECSRVPVCKGNLDHILGIISGPVYFLYRDRLHSALDLTPFLKKCFFAHETMYADTLLRQMYDRKESLAVIVDEYGALSGLISLEDLIEVVVGEIIDRRDTGSMFTRSGEHVIIASGKMELAELAQIFGLHLKSRHHMVTLGGWLTEQFGDIPKTGAQLNRDDCFFQVLAADKTRVNRVYMRRRGRS